MSTIVDGAADRPHRLYAAAVRFELDDPTRPEVRGLLDEHLADMHVASPPGSVHALDPTSLRAPAVTFWTAWEGRALRGCGAVKDLGDGDVELKSMRTTRAARGRGVGTALLRHLLGVAVARGSRRVLLETGSQEFFAPARRLYARHGFVVRGPFADYTRDPNSVFMELWLHAPESSGEGACPR